MEGINLAPIIQFRDDTPAAPAAPLKIAGVAPALRPYLPDSIPVPPEPSPKEPTYSALAAKQRQALFADKDFVSKYQNGHVEADRIIKTLLRIETAAKNVSEEELQPLANQIGLLKPQPLLDLPAVDPMEHRGAVATDYRLTAA